MLELVCKIIAAANWSTDWCKQKVFENLARPSTPLVNISTKDYLVLGPLWLDAQRKRN